MNKSIYTEYANLTPYQIKYLVDSSKIKKLDFDPETPCKLLMFDGDEQGREYFWNDDRLHIARYTHLPTGDAFCQGVAGILGIEYVPEGTKTETTTEDKGLAIDVKLLSEENREWLNINKGQPLPWDKGWGFCTFDRYDLLCLAHKNYLEEYKISITTDPNEFMRYVATKTGKEWDEKPMFGKNQIEIDLDEQLFPGRQNMGEGALTNEDVMELLGDKVGYGSYKTYRILDSLDGVPLDKRIPLSEWIPPFGTKVKFEFPDNIIYGRVNLISKDGMEVLGKFFKCYVGADGHWMRIV